MTRSQTHFMMRERNPDKAKAVLDYIRAHHYATVEDMKKAGLDVPRGVMLRLRTYGLIDRHDRDLKGHVIWKVV